MTKISKMLHETVVQLCVKVLRIHEHHILGFSISIGIFILLLLLITLIAAAYGYHQFILRTYGGQ